MSELPPENTSGEISKGGQTYPQMLIEEAVFLIDGVRYGVLPKDAIAAARKDVDAVREALDASPEGRFYNRKIGVKGGKVSRLPRIESEHKEVQSNE